MTIKHKDAIASFFLHEDLTFIGLENKLFENRY